MARYAFREFFPHVAKFCRNENGNVMMTFATMALILSTLVGSAVDLSRWLNARDHTISAIDAAVLAAGRALQTGSTAAEAQAIAAMYYLNNTKDRTPLDQDTVSFLVSSDRTTVKAVGSARIRVPFIGLADLSATDLDYLQLFTEAEAPEATTKTEKDINVNREIAIMLDVSGSMCSPCTKRDDMKLAAKDLVNIVIKDSPGQYWTKVAIVPFSGDVRPPAAVLANVTDPAAPASRRYSRRSNWDRTDCVAERTGDEKFTDAPANSSSSYIRHTYTSDGQCSTPVSGTVKPLSSVKADVIAAINGLDTGGGTAGHIGTAWAYYMLSPRWASALPNSSAPSAYGTTGLKKTAILMTDGEYNFTYDSSGFSTSEDRAGPSANGLTSAQQAVQICNAMKADGIEVFTVGFDLGGNTTAINTLNSCASDPTKAYLATNGEALKQVFRDIAVKMTELHLLR